MTPLPTRAFPHAVKSMLVSYPVDWDMFTGVINGASQYPSYLYSHSTLLWPYTIQYPTVAMKSIVTDFRAITVTDPDNKCKTWLQRVCKWDQGQICHRTNETQSIRYTAQGTYFVGRHTFDTFEIPDPPFASFRGRFFTVWPTIYYDSVLNLHVPLMENNATFKGRVGHRASMPALECAGPY